MQKFYGGREFSGPDFDDRLIRLVRKNPAIYDVNHPHYRRNPVRVAIWDRIASELGASSKFLQTKWKNIRYNYLQEIKCLETGHSNANIRKRRFTEDLSFLQNTAQSYNVKKNTGKNSSYSSDNESNSYLYPDPPSDAFEIIEIDQSDDGGDDFEKDSKLNITNGGGPSHSSDYKNDSQMKLNETAEALEGQDQQSEIKPDVTIEQTFKSRKFPDESDFYSQPSPSQFDSDPCSPLLTPMVILGNGHEHEDNNGTYNEVTIEPISKSVHSNKRVSLNHATENCFKRKSLSTPIHDMMPFTHPIEMYCLSLVDSLRNMPRSERERVKFEFAKILKDATYKDQS